MPQWRKLHIKTIESLDVNDMPDDFVRLTWVMLPLILDSKGRISDNVNLIRSRLYPLREDVTAERVNSALEWFSDRGMIKRYRVGERRYLCVPTWLKYQGAGEREAASNYPAPPELEPVAVPYREWPDLDALNDSRPTHEQVVTKSRLDVDVDVDVEESENKPASPEPTAHPPKKDKAYRPDQLMFSALQDVCNVLRVTESFRGWANTTVKWLADNAYNVGDVKNFNLWWISDVWRKERQPMTQARFDQNFSSWVKQGKPRKVSNGSNNNSAPKEDTSMYKPVEVTPDNPFGVRRE